MTLRSEHGDLGAEGLKIITLARSARARNGVPEGAAVRDETGRTYVAGTVELESLKLSALRTAVAMAVASGAQSLEAASGGVLQPFDGLLNKYPDWLREQLQHCAKTPIAQNLSEHLPAVAARNAPEPLSACEQLSSRELAVLKLIALGCSNQEISDQIGRAHV